MIVYSLMVYLCDKQKECKNSRSCGVFCNHTTDPDHAKNGAVHSPEETKDRFDELPVFESNNLFYVEREDPTDDTGPVSSEIQ